MNNIVWHNHKITKTDREKLNGHKGVCIWFTGLSGSGKSTLANELEAELNKKEIHTYLLDGDNVRHGLCGDLGFSDVARRENIRRIGEVSKLFVDAGMIVLTAFISPFRSDRRQVRKILGGRFVEIYCDCPLNICESRDVKGLYKRARAGEVKEFTGISSPYEAPEAAEITVNTNMLSLHESTQKIVRYLTDHELINLSI